MEVVKIISSSEDILPLKFLSPMSRDWSVISLEILMPLYYWMKLNRKEIVLRLSDVSYRVTCEGAVSDFGTERFFNKDSLDRFDNSCQMDIPESDIDLSLQPRSDIDLSLQPSDADILGEYKVSFIDLVKIFTSVSNGYIVGFSSDKWFNIVLSKAFYNFYVHIDDITELGIRIKEAVESKKFSLCE